jgi:CSLREA domain-containing protein
MLTTARRSVVLAVTGLAVAGSLSLPSASAAGRTFRVNTTVDAVDASPGDGVCATAQEKCSLRAAVIEADLGQGGDTILLPAGRFRLTIAPPLSPVIQDFGDPARDPLNGDLNVLMPTTIKGAGMRRTVVDGNHVDRVFSLHADSTVQDLTVTGGDPHEREVPTTTGGGGIGNDGNSLLLRVLVTGNTAAYGGGVFSIPGSFITVRDSIISGNVAGEAGGIRIDDKGLIERTVISGNHVYDFRELTRPGGTAGKGGGVDLRGPGADIVDSVIVGNTAVEGGGAINISLAYIDAFTTTVTDLVPDPGFGVVRLKNVRFSGNSSPRGGATCASTVASYQSLGGNRADDRTCHLTQRSDRQG